MRAASTLCSIPAGKIPSLSVPQQSDRRTSSNHRHLCERHIAVRRCGRAVAAQRCAICHRLAKVPTSPPHQAAEAVAHKARRLCQHIGASPKVPAGRMVLEQVRACNIRKPPSFRAEMPVRGRESRFAADRARSCDSAVMNPGRGLSTLGSLLPTSAADSANHAPSLWVSWETRRPDAAVHRSPCSPQFDIWMQTVTQHEHAHLD